MKKVWTKSDQMAYASEQADAELRMLFPGKDVDYYDEEDDCLRYKDYYQDIFNGLYDDVMNKIEETTSKMENIWLGYELGGVAYAYRLLDKDKYIYEVEKEGGETKTIHVRDITIGEVLDMGIDDVSTPIMLAILKYESPCN